MKIYYFDESCSSDCTFVAAARATTGFSSSFTAAIMMIRFFLALLGSRGHLPPYFYFFALSICIQFAFAPPFM